MTGSVKKFSAEQTEREKKENFQLMFGVNNKLLIAKRD